MNGTEIMDLQLMRWVDMKCSKKENVSMEQIPTNRTVLITIRLCLLYILCFSNCLWDILNTLWSVFMNISKDINSENKNKKLFIWLNKLQW